MMGWLERQVLLQIIDNRWREHLYEMDYLREGIHLRGFAQIDPLVAYKNEGFMMFEELMASIWQEFARVIFHVEVNVEPKQREEMEAPPDRATGSELLGRHRGGPAVGPPRRRGSGGSPGRRWADRDRAGEAGHARERDVRERREPHYGREVREREARPQRPMLVRLRQKVQELPRGLRQAPGGVLGRPSHSLGIYPSSLRRSACVLARHQSQPPL